ncbi:hypothetical protein GCM10008018_43940 [Paenibacillus marchantiophytorum]|uniref:Calcineurin-like phosphoesterase domain-containing protein n=1 Tax=Paenibacillus marchantiophytorum TaxID=1619310 RepID=A0ABQ1EZB6_9BACL|nr:hypothetical protein GCM10008018_43940 [Paenibacillus marchantiophytorum]
MNGKLVNIVNQINPDIVFITGDLVSKQKKLEKIILELSKINSEKIFFVPGNYEREEVKGFKKRHITKEQYRYIRRELENIGIIFLENGNSRINIRGREISIYGFDNSIYGNEKYNMVSGKESEYRIILAQSPNIINKLTDMGIK